jgi:serine/threonine protein kinase
MLDIFIKKLENPSHNILNLFQEISSGELRVVKSLFITPNNKELEREEIVLKKKIVSPYIVKYYGYYINNDHKCFVMEYCEKGTLRNLIDFHIKNENKSVENDVFFFFLL